MIPERFVQIVTLGGFVFDVSHEQWAMLKDEMKNVDEFARMPFPARFLSFEDIYGATCDVRPESIVGARETSSDIEATYRETHNGESWTGD